MRRTPTTLSCQTHDEGTAQCTYAAQRCASQAKVREKKLLLPVRYSLEVVEDFRSTGDGWQARIDSVLRQYVSQRVPQSNAT
jgi:uncharacterized protein (DUF4415 family)